MQNELLKELEILYEKELQINAPKEEEIRKRFGDMAKCEECHEGYECDMMPICYLMGKHKLQKVYKIRYAGVNYF